MKRRVGDFRQRAFNSLYVLNPKEVQTREASWLKGKNEGLERLEEFQDRRK